MKFLSRGFLRSVRGQLMLLAGAFAGAVVMAVGAVVLRGWVFEPYVREWRSPRSHDDELLHALVAETAGIDEVKAAIERAAEKLAVEARRTAADEPDAELRKRQARPFLARAERRVLDDCYFTWLQAPADEDRQHILDVLAQGFPKTTIFFFHRTAAVGNLHQRSRAVDGAFTLAGVDRPAARTLLSQVKVRAERHGETELARHADAALGRLREDG